MPKKKCPPCKALKANLRHCKRRNCKPGPHCHAHRKANAATQLARKLSSMSVGGRLRAHFK